MKAKEQARRFLISRIAQTQRSILETPKELEGMVDDDTIQKIIDSLNNEIEMFIYLQELNEDA